MNKISNKCDTCIYYDKAEKRIKNKFHCAICCEEYGKFQIENVKKFFKLDSAIKDN